MESHLADRLVLLVIRIVTGEKEATISTSAFTGPMETTYHYKIQGITHSLKIILFELEEMDKKSGELLTWRDELKLFLPSTNFLIAWQFRKWPPYPRF